MEAIIFSGVQGSGKSTFYIQNFFDTHIRVSMDLLRTRNREQQMLELCLRTSARFVVDNTNPTAEERQRYLAPALAAGYQLSAYFFNTPLEEALLRNESRKGKAQIPERGVRGTHKKLQIPRLEEGFHRLYEVVPASPFGFQIRELQE